MKIVSKEDAPRAVPEEREFFTGRVGMTPLVSIDEKILVRVVTVSFEPRARTHWHTHPAGQVLHVVKGTGWVQTWEEKENGKKAKVICPEDVVYIPPDEKHWHGASPGEGMDHIAHSMGGATEWMEAVSEEDYTNAS